MSYRIITDYGQRAVEALPSGLRTPGFEAATRALVQPLQVLEDFCAAIFTGFNVDNATNPQLSQLGKLVNEAQGGLNEAQGGLTDAQYRRIIRAKARALRSTGAARDILDVARLLMPAGGTVRLVELGYASYSVLLIVDPGDPWGAEFRQRARRVLDVARSAGWSAEYTYAEFDAFAYDGPPQPGFDVGPYTSLL